MDIVAGRVVTSLSVTADGTWSAEMAGGARAVFGSRADGDFSQPGRPADQAARSALADVPWTWLSQVHGAGVVVVDEPGQHCGRPGDAAVSAVPGAGLVVLTADCAPVGLSSPQGVVGVAHAGWRGLLAGVVEATVAAMRELGADEVVAVLGPCIRPHAYRFSPPDLDVMTAAFGPAARSVDTEGYPSLDLAGALGVSLGRAGATLAADAGTCTHCSGQHWSWRAGKDTARQATVVWQAAPTGPGLDEGHEPVAGMNQWPA
jgi:hypothetical protein